MNPIKGYYSLVQYCPDASRAEAANVGVLLFCPEIEFIQARVSQGNDRIRRFFEIGGPDLERVNAVKQALVKRLEVDKGSFRTLEDLQRFIGTRAHEVVITPPRPVKVLDPAADLDSLFAELVGGRATRSRTEGMPEIPELDQGFRQPRFHSRIEFNQRVSVPVVGRAIEIPYAYRNGAVKLVKPHRFSTNEPAAVDAAMRLAVEGDLLQKYPEEGTQRRLIVVSFFEDPESEVVSRLDELFREYQVELVRQERVPAFVEQVAHEVGV